MSSPSPLTIPLKFKRKSSSASTSTSMDNYSLSAPYSSPLPSSSPLLAPLHLTRRNECTEWQAGDYFDDLDEAVYDQQGKVEASYPWSCRTRPEHTLPCMHRPLPSLMTKFGAHALQRDALLPYSPSSFSYASRTTHFYPHGDSAVADDGEEYDLESMDIHIRETYFATSAERGRWLSSPIASRVRPQAIPPMRGHSSPIKALVDASPSRERLRRHKIRRSVDGQIYPPSSQDRDEDMRCSSPLPPSSPLTSPVSNLSFLSDDCDGDSVIDPRSNSDECHSLTGTPGLSISSTTCPSPVPARTSTPEAPATVPAHQPTCSPPHSAGSVISRHTSLSSPKPIDNRLYAPNTTDPEPDCILSPLSQFELDLPEAEPPKLPLSDTVNKPYPGQHLASLTTTVDSVRRQNGPPSTQSLSMNSNGEPMEVSLDTVGGSGSDKKAKKRMAPANPGARWTKKRAATPSGSPSSDVKKRRGAKSRSSNHSEPLSKKSKLSHCGDDLESRGTKFHPRRGGLSKVQRFSPSSSRPAVEQCDSESACPRDRKTPKPTGRSQQPTPSSCTTPISMDVIDVESQASLTGMLIEALATSRATSMDASTLYLVLIQAHPNLATERGKERLLMDIATVLEAGRARCGMFEKVDGSGERSRHKALENRWFYVPERDEDPERASLISAIMPRQKRNETKKYKQYYYRPLDKMSRWDPEDAP